MAFDQNPAGIDNDIGWFFRKLIKTPILMARNHIISRLMVLQLFFLGLLHQLVVGKSSHPLATVTY
jgi:hypothetical protein